MKTLIVFFVPLLLLISSSLSLNAQGIVDGTWIPRSSEGFSARKGPASVVVDGKIYVLNGLAPGNVIYRDSIVVYDPVSDSWSTPITIGQDTPRYMIAADVVDGKIYAIGGSNSVALTTLQVYDPSKKTWTTPVTTGTFTARDALTTGVVDNKIYAIGGEDDFGPVNTVEVYDPAHNTWSTPTTTGTFVPTSKLTSCVVNNKIYVIGGYDGSMDLNTVEIFDPATNVWTSPTTTGTATPRDALTSCVVNGKIYVIGGFSNGQTLNTVEIFDPATNAWSTPVTSGTFTPRCYLTCSAIGDSIYVMGGFDTDRDSVLNTNEELVALKSGVTIKPRTPELRVSPNPTSGMISLRNLPEHIQHLSVTNVLGELILEREGLNLPDITIDLSKQPQGSYYVRIVTATSSESRLIVRE
ncbi:MAG: kelch repeat-containing protein [Bacteroidota bacterium]|nr:kelch repeat-containing protein [Bacteroidota bacterium]